MFKIPKQEYTAEFKEGAVQRVSGGEGIRAVAKDLGLVEQTLRNWVKAAKAGKLHPAGGKVKRFEDLRRNVECDESAGFETVRVSCVSLVNQSFFSRLEHLSS